MRGATTSIGHDQQVDRDLREAPSSTRAYWYVLAVLWLVPVLLAVAGSLLLPDENANGQCEGIGFGCSLTPADTAPLLVVLAAPFLVGGGLVALLVLALARRWTTFARAPQAVQAGAVVGFVVGAAALVLATR